MSTPAQLIEQAFENLSKRPGFVDRPFQRQLALLLSDLIDQSSTGAFEAPTGLGKSLAALIPAIAHAIAGRKRTVIATYTNVLAEQYWRSDLPLALSLFDQDPTQPVKAQLLMGRQRYACLATFAEQEPLEARTFRKEALIGNESEFRQLVGKRGKELNQLWQKVATPPVCPGRLCPDYDGCFYYKARRGAEKAEIVITNHSVVISDALMSRDDSEGLLGKYDFLILDEAHDFPQAAINGLEFELSGPKLSMLAAVSGRLENTLLQIAGATGDSLEWAATCAAFRENIDRCQRALVNYGLNLGPGILTATPAEVLDHPQVQLNKTEGGMYGARQIADRVAGACKGFGDSVNRNLEKWREQMPELTRTATETSRNYLSYIQDFGTGATLVFEPQGVAVSYAGRNGADAILRQDIIALAEPLKELIWSKTPYACLSATLALDGTFDFFTRSTGTEPLFQEILPTPFDFTHQAALYLPPEGMVPDPTIARKNGTEDDYFRAVAREIQQIIEAAEGRTLALFHSRREMEGVMQHMTLPPHLPVYSQMRSGVSTVGERFIKNVNASLFALRSYWTGFDAPGETLSVVVLVRVPFEVPTDPPQIARMAYLQTQGLDAFREHTLPLAKMLMRQGAGRLIRRDGDKGIIALLDPRLQTKRYGEEILDNLPAGMRTYRDIRDAIGWIGLNEPEPALR
ncbi:MAG TPA: ATP-dependent DNA helicase [Fimbriimonas sp.]|nr:ATP-dependent DNA helicase [Fimbriimonas sp.]